MTQFYESFAIWLADCYLLSSVLLILGIAALATMKQPAHRRAVTHSILVALVMLAVLCAMPGRPVVNLTASENSAEPKSPLQVTLDDPNETIARNLQPLLRARLLDGSVPPTESLRADSGVSEASPAQSHLSTPPSVNRMEISWRALAVIVWAVGALSVLAWLAIGAATARRLRRAAHGAPDHLTAVLHDAIGRSKSIRRPAAVLASSRVEVAVAIGVWRPAVLLPTQWIEVKSRDELRAVLAHEAAHLRNDDLQWLALSRALAILLWAQPLFWLVRRRMRLDQEVLADAAAAQLTSRQTYAEQLVAWARDNAARPAVRFSSAVGLWEGPSQLRRRIALLIDERFVVDRVCPRRWHRGAAIIAMLGAFLLSTVTFKPAARLAVADEPASAEPAQGGGDQSVASPQFAKRSVPIEGRTGEGWKQTVSLPVNQFGDGGQVKLSVEEGWLCARRESSDGRLDWQIVLCELKDGAAPRIEIMNDMPYFVDISCHDGRYFIRESQDLLRSIRQRSSSGTLLSKDAILSAEAKQGGWGKSPTWVGIICTAWIDDDWFFVASGPGEESWRSIVRLDPMDAPGGHGVTTNVAGHIRYHHGDKWLVDDGELLMAERTTLAMHEALEKERAKRDAILAGQLPPIDASAWLNTDDAPTWESLKGKVVLVDFWGTWCGPCVEKLPIAQTLHDKYSDRGLVVVGIHSAQGSDACAEFLKQHNYTFPVALDSGKTAESFAVSSWPTYFLIDRTGKVVQGFTNEPPTEKTIEELFADERAQKSESTSSGRAWENAGGIASTTVPIRLVQNTTRATSQDRPPALLSYGDGKADGKKSYGGSGHFIRFVLPDGVTKVRGIRIHASRYGYPRAPDEDAEITLLSDDLEETLHTEAAPYRTFKRGKQGWVRVMFDEEVELPQKFWISLNFNAEQTKGVYVSYDTSTKGEYSRVGLPGDEEQPRETDFAGDWMIQVMLSRPK